MANPELALETHAREELGIDPRALGSPWQAAIASFAAFSLGAFLPLSPWLIGGGTAAVIWSIVLGLSAASLLGATVAQFSGRPMWRGAFRQFGVTTVAAAVTTGIGALVGAG
jgi:VIT1/CCC1 family predicted Fe2+/Mn2+ transporter